MSPKKGSAMKFRHTILPTTIAALLALTIGCEWTGTSSDEAWNDAYAWVNFSGTYRLYNTVSAEPDEEIPTEETIVVPTTTVGSTTYGETKYTGKLPHAPIAGTLVLKIDDYLLTDTGAGTLTGMGGAVGTIVYGTGAWTADTGSGTGANKPITVSYAYKKAGTQIVPGSDGSSILTLIVSQKGNLLTFTDNLGTVYSGRVTQANVPAESQQAGNIRLNFEVTADNKAKIVGTLSGDWSGGTAGTLANRSLLGTYWRGKNSVDLQGASGSISITPLPLTSN